MNDKVIHSTRLYRQRKPSAERVVFFFGTEGTDGSVHLSQKSVLNIGNNEKLVDSAGKPCFFTDNILQYNMENDAEKCILHDR